MDRDELIAFLRENLSIETKRDTVYNGGMDGSGSMYSDSTTVRLVLCGEVISEDYL